MEQKFIDLWFKNKNKLKEELIAHRDLEYCTYADLLKLTIQCIINRDSEDELDVDKIIQIDNGDYQGTLIFIIPRDTYQPAEYEHYVTYVDYGSCSYCDTLLHIQADYNYVSKDQQVDDFMTLCLHMIERMKKLYSDD